MLRPTPTCSAAIRADNQRSPLRREHRQGNRSHRSDARRRCAGAMRCQGSQRRRATATCQLARVRFQADDRRRLSITRTAGLPYDVPVMRDSSGPGRLPEKRTRRRLAPRRCCRRGLLGDPEAKRPRACFAHVNVWPLGTVRTIDGVSPEWRHTFVGVTNRRVPRETISKNACNDFARLGRVRRCLQRTVGQAPR